MMTTQAWGVADVAPGTLNNQDTLKCAVHVALALFVVPTATWFFGETQPLTSQSTTRIIDLGVRTKPWDSSFEC